MRSADLYGVAYRLQYPVSSGARAFEITFSFASSFTNGGGYVRLPRTWRFALDAGDGFTLERFGASETRGLFGGIENTRQKAMSEACERAIGEVLTVTLCEILDSDMDRASEKIVMILGPALPKSVGRLASLRLASQIRVAFICPKKFPTWITEKANEPLIVPPYPPSAPSGEGWEDEPLIIGYELSQQADNSASIVQELQMWGTVPQIDKEELSWTICDPAPCETNTLTTVSLPREIIVAAGQVENHTREPYLPEKLVGAESKEAWRDLPPGFNPRTYRVVPTTAFSPSRPGKPPGWPVRWEDATKQN